MKFSKNPKRQDLDNDEQFTLALTRLLEVIGEAAGSVVEDIQTANPQVPWRAIIGTRNRLIHGYFDVDKDIIWNIVSRDMPPLFSELRRILSR